MGGEGGVSAAWQAQQPKQARAEFANSQLSKNKYSSHWIIYLESGSTLFKKKDIHNDTIDKIIGIKPVSFAGADTGNDTDKTSQKHSQAKENGY